MPRGGARFEYYQIQRPRETADAGGGYDPSSRTVVVDCWARVRPLRGAETALAGQMLAAQVQELRIPDEGVEILPRDYAVDESGHDHEVIRVGPDPRDRRALLVEIRRKVTL